MAFGFLPAYDPDDALDIIASEEGHLRVRSIAMHGASAAPLVTVVLLPGSGPEQRTVLDVGLLGVPALLAAQAAEGFHAVKISATGDEQGFVYGFVFEKRATPTAVSAVVVPDPKTEFGAVLGAGVPLSLDVFSFGLPAGGASVPFYAMVVDPSPTRSFPFAIYRQPGGASSFAQSAFYEAMQRGWARPEIVVPGPTMMRLADEKPPLLADGPPLLQQGLDALLVGLGYQPNDLVLPPDTLSLWLGDTYEPWPPQMAQSSFTGGVRCHGPMQLYAMLDQIQELSVLNRWPIHVGANGVGDATWFCVLSAPAGMTKPLGRKTTVVGPLVDLASAGGLPQVDLGAFGAGSNDASARADTSPADVEPRAGRSEGAPASGWLGRVPRPPRGPTGGGPPPTQATEIVPTVSTLQAPSFVDFLESKLNATGARVGVAVVARNGRCVHATAVTRAEEGYPVASVHSNLRIGSVSKPLTGMAIVAAAVAVPDGLATTVKDALGLAGAPNAPALDAIRVEELLVHRSGWGGTNDGTASFDGFQVAELAGPLVPGALREFLGATSQSLTAVSQLPKLTANYSNWNYIALREILSRWRGKLDMAPGTADYSKYVERILDWWDLTSERAHPYGPSWPVSRALGDAPCHLRSPGVLQGPSGGLEAWQYGEDATFMAGATGWTMSIVELVRLVSSMDPGAIRPELLGFDQVQQLTAPYQVPGMLGMTVPVSGTGRGFFYTSATAATSAIPGISTTVLFHNGMMPGGGALLVHVLPQNGVSPSLTIAVAFNLDISLGNADITQLLTTARFFEDQGLWHPGDLFDAL